MKNTHEKGNIGELRAAFEAAKRGYVVSIPVGHDARYDLLVERREKIERVQVKTVQSDGKVIEVRTKSIGKLNGRTIAKKYNMTDTDWIFVYDLTTDVCLFIPSSELGVEGKHSIAVRIEPPLSGQRKKLKWVSDYQEW